MRISLAPLVLILAATATPRLALADGAATLQAHLGDGPTATVAIHDQFALIGHGSYLEVIDITTPEAPTLVHRHRVDAFITHVEISGDLACVHGEMRGIYILDLTDVHAPQLQGFVPTDGPLRNLEIHGDLLLYCLASSFHVIDIGDPAAPVELGVYERPNLIGFSVWGDHAYVSAMPYEIEILNLTDPTAPWLEAVIPGAPAGTYVRDVLCADGLLYAVRHDFYGFRNVRIYDLADPAQPAELSALFGDLDLQEVFAHGNLLHFTTSDGIALCSIADPAAPVFLGADTTIEPNYELALTGDLILSAQTGFGLRIYNAGGSLRDVDLVEVGHFSDGFYGGITDVDVTGDLMVTAATAPSLAVYDIADPQSPVLLGSLHEHVPGQPDVRCFELEVHGDLAVLRCSEGGTTSLRVIDLADPTDPQELTAMPGEYRMTQFAGTLAYARFPGDPGEIEIIDFADPAAPVTVSSLRTPDWDAHVLTGDRLLVAMEGDLVVFDLADPLQPAERGRAPLDWADQTLYVSAAVAGDVVYLVARLSNTENAMRMVEFGDPDYPVVHVGPVPGDEPWGIDSDGEYLYLAIGPSGTSVYSLDLPLAPELVGQHPAAYWAWNVNVDGGVFGLANSEAGVLVYRNELVITAVDGPAAAPGALQLTSHPNPFNPLTRLTFVLPSPGPAKLSIFDARGRRLRVLLDGHREAGPHTIAWDGRDTAGRLLPSGVYFAILDGESGTAARKLVLVR